MYTESFTYYTNRYGFTYENTQIRIGVDTAGNIRSFVKLYYNSHDEWEEDENGDLIPSKNRGVQEPDMSLDGLTRFLSSLNEEDSWYGKSSSEEFLRLALHSPQIESFPPQFEAGMKLPL